MGYARFVDPTRSPLTDAIRRVRAEADLTRPAGLHLSRICDDYHRTLYPPKTRTPMTEAMAAGYQELGNAFESALGAVLARRFADWTKPEPRVCDGVLCSPDGANVKTRTIEETKITWVSSARFLEIDGGGQIVDRSNKFTAYESRLLGYLKAWGWTRALLHVWFVCGDWRPPVPEWPRTIILRYPQREIDEHWRRLIVHARDRKWLR